ncbi:DNRLRE domain-containing protein [Streptomyces sp. NPDC127084]|uniref:DNRLRE domain-containing protein n=1 Tax=Streptomyces sp. NPDC127084 TaxID=3347133 RepID=UPI0036550FAB
MSSGAAGRRAGRSGDGAAAGGRRGHLRRVAGAVSLLLAAEAALVVEPTGTAVAVVTQSVAAAKPPSAKAKAKGPAEARDEASATLMARLQNRRIEILALRSAVSTTWALPSGLLKTSVSAAPVRVQQDDGSWQDIDTSLSDTGASLTPEAAVAEVAVSDGGDKALASVSKGDRSFGLGWEDKLPTPVVKEDTASYALGGGRTLKVSALAQGFSQYIVLDRAPEEAQVYRMPLNLDGLKLSQAESGHLLLKDTSGKLVAEAPAPVMWDSTRNPASGEPEHQARVTTAIETDDNGKQTLVLKPDAAFLATATYPVIVDPTSTLATTTDTWVQTPGYTDSQVSSGELKSGTYNGGTDKARSYLKFDVDSLRGKHIIDTNLALHSYYSSTCATTGAGTQVRRITGDWSSSSVTWGAQPATTDSGAVTNKAALGYSSSCPAGTMNYDIDAIVQSWADGWPNYGLQIRSADESDSLTWRRFRSSDYASGDNSAEPHLTVTYNSYTTTSSWSISPMTRNAYDGKRHVTSLTPILSAKVTDPDGSASKAQFEVTPDPNYADTTYTYTGTSASVASGSAASITIPQASALPAGAHLRFRARGHDGTDYGPWSGHTTFLLNTEKPAAPTVRCDAYPEGTWTAKADGPVTCTLDTDSADGQGFNWGLDDGSMPNRVNDTTDGTGGDTLTFSLNPTDGWRSLYAQTIDAGGNVSAATTRYSFGVGTDGAGLLTPADGDTSARRIGLTAKGRTGYTAVTYQYRRGETDSWQNVPAADVTRTADGSALSAWPVATTDGAPPALTWNVTSSLTEDGPIDIRAAFTNATTTGHTQTATVTVDRKAGTAPSQSVGPGSVNLLTGDYSLSATDASGFGASISRTASSRRPSAGADAEGQAAVFGPQWASGISADLTESGWAYVRKTSATSVALVDFDGTETGFTAASSGGWSPEPGSGDLALTGSLTGSFTLKDDQGTTTTFAKVASGATTWQVSSTYLPTDNSTTKVVSEAVTVDGKVLARPRYVIAPTSAASAATCESTPSTAGCRILEFIYATSTTAAGADLGDHTGRVRQIMQWATEPGASAATATAVAQYAYDDSGRLRQVWDPRISPALKTAYLYDSAGRVSTLTPPGELPWGFEYGKAGNAATAGDGMLLGAGRANLTPGSASELDGTAALTRVVYDVPVSGAKAPNAMSAESVGAWGQSDVPTDATAVFPADAVAFSHTGSDLSPGHYKRATVTYIGASGREVNTATPGGHITTTEYDRFGNVARELTAANRELALATGGDGLARLAVLGIGGMSTADRAERLSTRSVHSSDGLRKTAEYGPLHRVTLTSALKAGAGGTDLAAGTAVPARAHTATSYDEGRPTDGTATVSNQPTTVKTGAFVDGYPSDGDVRTATTSYDWAKGLPTSQVTDPDGLAIATTTSYDSQGRVTRTSLPKSSGSDAGTTVTTYYSATGTGACGGKPEWADLVCSTGPAGDITGGGANPSQLPTRTMEYDRWGSTAKTVETANGVTRTNLTVRDDAGRTILTVVAGSSGSGTAVPAVTTAYDADSGDVATTSSSAGTIKHVYDKLGREVSYSDGSGNTATTEYDQLGRPVKTTDSAPSTTTFSYDTAKDPRGLETSRTDSAAGTFTATYDADGDLRTRTLAGGYTLTTAQDETGAETSRVYTRDSDGTIVASDTADRTVHGQVAAESGSNGQTRTRGYTYDAAGRLTRADDTAPDGSCTRRDYTFDKNTNRTALITSTGDIGATCTSAGATTTSYLYDTGDRLVTSGTVHDAFGRTTSQSTGATIGYYANDLVRTQTSGTSRQTWTLDAVGRLAAWTTETNTSGTWAQTASKTNHYGTDGDSPDWTRETDGALTRNVQGAGGELDAISSATGDTVLQLTDIHGDTTVQLPLDTEQAPVALAYDEYGNARDASARYGWLGGKQRSGETVTGAILMGVRLYDPTTGRFLQVDPVPGGNANAYEYCNGDPVNRFDLDGRVSWDRMQRGTKRAYSWLARHRERIASVAGYASIGICAVTAGTACAVAGAAAFGLAVYKNAYNNGILRRDPKSRRWKKFFRDTGKDWLMGKFTGNHRGLEKAVPFRSTSGRVVRAHLAAMGSAMQWLGDR